MEIPENITTVQFWNTSITPKILHDCLQSIPIPLTTPSANNYLLSISRVSSFPDIFCSKWNHTIHSLMCLFPLT